MTQFNWESRAHNQKIIKNQWPPVDCSWFDLLCFSQTIGGMMGSTMIYGVIGVQILNNVETFPILNLEIFVQRIFIKSSVIFVMISMDNNSFVIMITNNMEYHKVLWKHYIAIIKEFLSLWLQNYNVTLSLEIKRKEWLMWEGFILLTRGYGFMGGCTTPLLTR